jgi:hypothetical protein
MDKRYDKIGFQAWLDNPITKDFFKIYENQEFCERFGWGNINLLTYDDFKDIVENE